MFSRQLLVKSQRRKLMRGSFSKFKNSLEALILIKNYPFFSKSLKYLNCYISWPSLFKLRVRESSALVSESGGGWRGGRFPVWVPTGAAETEPGGLVVDWSSSWWAFPFVISSSQFSDSFSSILTGGLVEVRRIAIATQLRSDKTLLLHCNTRHTHTPFYSKSANICLNKNPKQGLSLRFLFKASDYQLILGWTNSKR